MYDEHGGFFDHVMPPKTADDHPETSFLGVRVPAIIVSPFTGPALSKQPFDHTSVIRTILDRFCPTLSRFAMGARVGNARSLSCLLSSEVLPPAPVPIPQTVTLRHEEFVAAVTPPEESDLGPGPEELVALLDSAPNGIELARRLKAIYLDRSYLETDYRGVESVGEEFDLTASMLTPELSLPGRPLDDLQLGLLAAAKEIRDAEGGEATAGI